MSAICRFERPFRSAAVCGESKSSPNDLGIALIVIGLALVCGGLILWPRASRTEEEKKGSPTEKEKPEGGRSFKTGAEANPVSAPATLAEAGIDKGEMADLIKRFNEIGDDDPSN